MLDKPEASLAEQNKHIAIDPIEEWEVHAEPTSQKRDSVLIEQELVGTCYKIHAPELAMEAGQ